MSYSRSIPNQILHYTASSPGYPSHAFKVGNFAFSDAGNAPVGAYGEFRGGLNPYAFKTNEANRFRDFQNQTYVVYINRPPAVCEGPSCYLIDDTKIVPNTGDPYPGNPSSTLPWYNLIKFTQYIVGSVSGAITGTASGNFSPINYYGETLSDTLSDSATNRGILWSVFNWYQDRRATGDQNTYYGTTAGSIVLVNKFYPPIIANTSSRVFDCSFIPSAPYVPYDSEYNKVLGSNQTRGLFNLVGATHASTLGAEGPRQQWDFEGGHVVGYAGMGDHFYKIKADNGFSFAGETNTPNKWTLNLCVKVAAQHNGSNDYFITHGTASTSPCFWGLGWVETSPPTNPLLFESIKRNGGSLVDTTLSDTSFILNSWIYLTVTCEQNASTLNLKYYINGKLLPTTSGQGWGGSLTNTEQDITIYPYSPVSETDKYFKFLSYYTTQHTDATIKDNFLRYALNSKIKNNNIQLALDTGSLVSHQGTSQWIDISGNLLHGATASFTWGGYKPGYTEDMFKITHGLPLVDLFVNPFTISFWVEFNVTNTVINIFTKGVNILDMQAGGSIVLTMDDGTSTKTYTSTNLTAGEWYNIIVTGSDPNSVDMFIFSHNGSLQNPLPTITPAGGPINSVDDTSDIFVGDISGNVKVASVIYWNTRFSQALANDFFALQKARFGYDSNEHRIADIGVC